MYLPKHELRQCPTTAFAITVIVAIDFVGLLRRCRVPVHRLQRDKCEEKEKLLVVGRARAVQDRGGLLQGCGVQVEGFMDGGSGGAFHAPADATHKIAKAR